MAKHLFFFFLFFLLLFWNKTEKNNSFIHDPNAIIPKTIHYVWLGSKELPDAVKEAIASWKKHQPDFQIKRWDEEHCDINSNPFIKGAYQEKAYNFASDYCRVKALQEGGIYFDTDMVLKAPISPLLDEPLILTLQLRDTLSASFMAVVPNHPFVNALKENYEKRTKFSWARNGNAPMTWNSIFKQLFSLATIDVKREKGKYHIYDPTILMYDFNDGRNIAEHLFAAGSQTAQKSAYYQGFKKFYLNDFALYFPKTKLYFVFLDDTEGYFYDLKNSAKQKNIRYLFKNNILSLLYESKQEHFMCHNKKCDPLPYPPQKALFFFNKYRHLLSVFYLI